MKSILKRHDNDIPQINKTKRQFTDQRQKYSYSAPPTPAPRFPSVSTCHTGWHIMRRQSESSLPVTELCFTCEYPACIRWLWVGEPRATLRLYAQLCRRTVFTRHPRAHITSARAVNTESKIINPVLQGHTHKHTHTHTHTVYVRVLRQTG